MFGFGGGWSPPRREPEDEAPEPWVDPPPRAAPAQRRAVVADVLGAPTFAHAPLELLTPIFKALSTDDRMRCREVCGGWLDILCDTSFWTTLDLYGGLWLTLPTESFVRAASRLSGHTLVAIEAQGCIALSLSTVKRAMAANARTLTRVSLGRLVSECGERKNPSLVRMYAADFMAMFREGVMMVHGLEFRAAEDLTHWAQRTLPNLELLLVDLRATPSKARDLMNDPDYRPLAVRNLTVHPVRERVSRLTDGISKHRTLRSIDLTYLDIAVPSRHERDEEAGGAMAADEDAPARAAGDAMPQQLRDFSGFVDALIDGPHVEELSLSETSFCALALPLLGKLLHRGALNKLSLCGIFDCMHDYMNMTRPPFGTVPEEFCAGLRATRTLHTLALRHVDLFRLGNAGTAVLDALVGHPTVRSLELVEDSSIRFQPEPGGDSEVSRAEARSARAAAGAAIGALVAADTLHSLTVRFYPLGDRGWAATIAALGASKELRKLELSCAGLSKSCMANEVARAVEASCLRNLAFDCGCSGECGSSGAAGVAKQLCAFVAARATGSLGDPSFSRFELEPAESDESDEDDGWVEADEFDKAEAAEEAAEADEADEAEE